MKCDASWSFSEKESRNLQPLLSMLSGEHFILRFAKFVPIFRFIEQECIEFRSALLSDGSVK